MYSQFSDRKLKLIMRGSLLTIALLSGCSQSAIIANGSVQSTKPIENSILPKLENDPLNGRSYNENNVSSESHASESDINNIEHEASSKTVGGLLGWLISSKKKSSEPSRSKSLVYISNTAPNLSEERPGNQDQSQRKTVSPKNYPAYDLEASIQKTLTVQHISQPIDQIEELDEINTASIKVDDSQRNVGGLFGWLASSKNRPREPRSSKNFSSPKNIGPNLNDERPGDKKSHTSFSRDFSTDPITTSSIETLEPGSTAPITQDKIPDYSYELAAEIENKETQNLSFNSAIQITLESNPEVAIATAQEEDARLGMKIEQTGLTPQVDLTLSSGSESTYLENSSSPGVDRNEMNVSLRQTLYDFGATTSAIQRREALYHSAALRKLDTKEDVAMNVIKSYMNYLRQLDLVASSARNVAAHERIAKLVKLSEEGGNSSVADVKRVETRLDSAYSSKISNENALIDSSTAFRRVAGFKPQSIKRPKLLSPANYETKPGGTKANIINNPKLRSLAADEFSLVKQLKQQRATLYPELYATGEANYKSNVSGETGVTRDVKGMIVLKLRLFDGGKRMYVADQINQRIIEAEYQYKKFHRELSENYEQNKQILDTSRQKGAYLNDSLSAAKKVTELYAQQFRDGSRSPFELLDAQRDLHRAEQELINHQYNTALAKYQALRIRGDLVSSILN